MYVSQLIYCITHNKCLQTYNFFGLELLFIGVIAVCPCLCAGGKFWIGLVIGDIHSTVYAVSNDHNLDQPHLGLDVEEGNLSPKKKGRDVKG